MELTVRKLTPELLEDYLRFFETDAHADNPDEDRCYCVCWCREDHTRPTDFPPPKSAARWRWSTFIGARSKATWPTTATAWWAGATPTTSSSVG